MASSWFAYSHIENYAAYYNNEACTLTFRDPRASVMAGLNELMFRIGTQAAKMDQETLSALLDEGLEVNYTVAGTQREPQELFKTKFAYFFGAVALELLAIGLVASTFWGYWRLGREVSFCPLEIANVSSIYQCGCLANLSNLRLLMHQCSAMYHRIRGARISQHN